MRGNYYGIVTVKSTYEYTKICIDSFFKNTKLKENDKFILIDNDGYWSEKNLNPSYDILVNDCPKNFSENTNTLFKLAKQNELNAVFISNDVYLTPNWSDKLLDNAVSIPSCNQTHDYGILPSTSMEEFGNKYTMLNAIAYKHLVTKKQPYERLMMPMYLFKVPLEVINKVGYFDENFVIGGEDVDYRIRCLKEGFDFKYCSSFVLHFNGKSTWNGVEKKHETEKRNELYQKNFKEKWGTDLFNLLVVSGKPIETIDKYGLYDLFRQEKFNQIILKVLELKE